MKDVKHVFGLAQWWGEELFGISNALVGDWPVVEIRDQKARIVEFGSIPQWLKRHKNRLREEMHRLDQLWEQRIVQKDDLRSVFGMDIHDL
jgi:branched-chain amino acid transport system substrate-binding protein